METSFEPSTCLSLYFSSSSDVPSRHLSPPSSPPPHPLSEVGIGHLHPVSPPRAPPLPVGPALTAAPAAMYLQSAPVLAANQRQSRGEPLSAKSQHPKRNINQTLSWAGRECPCQTRVRDEQRAAAPGCQEKDRWNPISEKEDV